MLDKTEKFGLIGSVELWIEMRDVRNRIVHDHLPEQQKILFGRLMGDYGRELLAVRARIKKSG